MTNQENKIREVRRIVNEKHKLKKKLGLKCAYCECNNPLLLTIDHIMPKSRGGNDDISNKQVCCFICNQLKGPMDDKEFKKYFKALKQMYDVSKIRLDYSKLNVFLEFNQLFHPETKQ